MKRIFLVGCPRAGTTLLQSLIATNNHVFTLPETSFFLYLYGDYVQRFYGITSPAHFDVFRHRYRILRNQLGIANKTPSLVLAEMYRNVGKPVPSSLQKVRRWRLQSAVDEFVGTLDHFAKEGDSECWLEKTPGHFAYIPDIKRHVEDAYFVHLVRSPIENIASLRDAAKRFPDSEAWKYFGEIDVCIDVWRRSTEIAVKCAGHKRHVLIDYDDLCVRPRAVIARIEALLGIPNCDSADQEERRLQGAKKIVTKSEPWKSGVFSSIRNTSKVKSCLCDNEVAFLEGRLAETWQAFKDVKLVWQAS